MPLGRKARHRRERVNLPRRHQPGWKTAPDGSERPRGRSPARGLERPCATRTRTAQSQHLCRFVGVVPSGHCVGNAVSSPAVLRDRRIGSATRGAGSDRGPCRRHRVRDESRLGSPRRLAAPSTVGCRRLRHVGVRKVSRRARDRVADGARGARHRPGRQRCTRPTPGRDHRRRHHTRQPGPRVRIPPHCRHRGRRCRTADRPRPVRTRRATIPSTVVAGDHSRRRSASRSCS